MATNHKAAQELLRDAAREIDDALAQLDTYSSDCPTCGRKHFRNLTHARMREQLADLPEKLRRAADKVEQSTGLVMP
jgi:cell division protein ZapA (FtsZ GTPase activity inhibitor)